MSSTRTRTRRLLALFSVTLVAASGGPDSGGVVFTDSTEADGPPHGVLDVSGGTDLGLSDDGLASVDLPFAFDWYGTEYDAVTVSNNGTLFFDGAQSSPVSTCAGGTGTWSGIAAFADDLDAGTVRVATLGRYPHRVFAVEWQAPHTATTGEGTIQAWLLEGAGRRQESVIVLDDVTFGAASVDGGAGAVVGVQPGDGSAGLAWSCAGGLSGGTSAWFGGRGARPASTVRTADTLGVLWYGTDTAGYAGQSVAAGDVSGDGVDDLLVGQPQGDVAYLLYGGASVASGDLSSSAGVVLTYDESDSPDLADAVLLADLDGDGVDDLLIGAPLDDSAATNAGAVYGMAGGTLASAVSLPDDADLLLGGPTSVGDARAGRALASADLDGDGYGDLVIGAPYADTNATQSGAVYLWHGALSALDAVTDDLDAAAVLSGESATDWAGHAVAAQDLDGDGLAEILVGAPNVDDADNNAGAVYFLAGAASASSSRDLDSDSDIVILGDGADDKAGTGVGLGDVDGDGDGDLFFGAPFSDSGASSAGELYAFFDPLGATSSSYAASDADFVMYAVAANANFGAPLLASDLDGDGTDELLAAATGELTSVSGAGSVRIIDASVATTVTTASAESLLQGSLSAGQLGEGLAVAGDVDGDGYRDIVAGAPYADYGVTGAGAVFLWSSQPAFEDSDGDGFVTTASGGLDCDDDDSTVYPGAPEDSTDLIDNDCDGWVDDLYSTRGVSAWMDHDVAEVLGDSADADLFDMEDAASGDDLETVFSEQGLTMTPDRDAYVSASADVWGAAPAGDLGARLTPSSSGNSLTLTFSDAVDAISLRLLDVEDNIEMAALSGGSVIIEGASLAAAGDDRTGGVFLGVLFAESVDEVILTGPAADAWGLDDLRLHWADRTDRDGDGYTEDTGDCDDGDAAVYPGAEEDLTNGVDDDCDGSVDGGELEVYTSDSDWSSAAGLDEQTIDFEDLSDGDDITDAYADLGVAFDGDLVATDAVDGSAARDALAGGTASALTISFDEVQPAVGVWLLDVSGDLSVDGYADGALLYTTAVDISSDDTDGGSFLGLAFDYGVDELVLTSDTSGDDWGLDDLVVSALGLDDADGDGFTEADGDCDDFDSDTNPDAVETWYDGTDSDCDGASDYDSDGDGHDSSDYGGGDCVDSSGDINPDAEETWYDGTDSDCDGLSDYDSDGDGYDYDPEDPDGSEDCDDTDADTSPGAEETWYDGVDSDCAGDDDYDADGDGYTASGAGGVVGGEDCDDTSADIGPDAEEIWYDGVDQDCDEASDYDADGDGYEAESYGGEDCGDDDPTVYPGASGEVWYDGTDQDCDGASDYDQDGDGYDHDDYGGEDCDDTDDEINPGADDEMGDGIDSDCDGGPEYDDDGDGYDGTEDGGEDCDDEDEDAYPGADEVWYDGTDSDCDGASDYDADADGFDHDAYGGDDCDDADATVNPDAVDYYYDDIDQDCDGADDFDADEDGHASDWYGGDDCDDGDATINPSAAEVWYDGTDSDCDGLSDYDADGDTYSADGYGGADCDDTDAAIHPGAEEIPFDTVDQDCDGIDDVDDDGDGFYSSEDCDDLDGMINPDAEESWYDGTDSDCDGASDYDADQDGYDAVAFGGDDCDDEQAAVSPGAAEVWYDGTDSNCDELDDYDADQDGYRPATWGGDDCNDGRAAVNPGVKVDDCNGVDNDCDGTVDEDCVQSGGGDTGDTGGGGKDSGGREDTGEPGGGGEDSGTADTGTDTPGEPGGDPNADWTPPEAGKPSVAGDSGCAAVAGGAGWWAALLVVWRRRRRPLSLP